MVLVQNFQSHKTPQSNREEYEGQLLQEVLCTQPDTVSSKKNLFLTRALISINLKRPRW